MGQEFETPPRRFVSRPPAKPGGGMAEDAVSTFEEHLSCTYT